MNPRRLPLRAIRAAQEGKVSQSKLARKTGLTLYRCWQLENGDGPEPTKEEQAVVASALGVRPSDIAWAHDAREERAS